MIINGRSVQKSYEKINDFLSGIKLRINSENEWLTFMGKQVYTQFVDLQRDYADKRIDRDTYQRYLIPIGEFFTLLTSERKHGDFKDVFTALENEMGKQWQR